MIDDLCKREKYMELRAKAHDQEALKRTFCNGYNNKYDSSYNEMSERWK